MSPTIVKCSPASLYHWQHSDSLAILRKLKSALQALQHYLQKFVLRVIISRSTLIHCVPFPHSTTSHRHRIVPPDYTQDPKISAKDVDDNMARESKPFNELSSSQVNTAATRPRPKPPTFEEIRNAIESLYLKYPATGKKNTS